MACPICQKGKTGLLRKWQAKDHTARRGDQKVKERALLCEKVRDILKKALAIFFKKTVDLFRFFWEYTDRLKCHEDVPGAKAFPVFSIASGSNNLTVIER